MSPAARVSVEFESAVLLFDEISLRRTNAKNCTRRFGNDLFGNGTDESSRQPVSITHHHRDQVDVVIDCALRNLARRLAFDQNAFGVDALENRIRKPLFVSDSQTRLRILHTEHHDSTATMPRKCSSIL